MAIDEILSAVERILRIGITVSVAYLVALWVATIWWTFRDIRSRTTDIVLIAVATALVTVFSFPGLLIYFILRPPRTLTEVYEEELEEEALLQELQVHAACPVCKQRTDPDFIFCPVCQNRLKRPCPSCDRPLNLKWRCCPYCGQRLAQQPGERPHEGAPEHEAARR